VAQLARHPQRPYTLDYAASIFEEFTSCTATACTPTISRSWAASRGSRPAGHAHRAPEGRDTKERVRRNYGIQAGGLSQGAPADEARGAFRIPVITLIDTRRLSGVGSEERNQSEADRAQPVRDGAAARAVITAVIGEVARAERSRSGVRRLIMLQYSVYSSSLRRDARRSCGERRQEGTRRGRDGITAERLSKLGLVDEVLKEPLGGAHRDPQVMADALQEALVRNLAEVANWPEDELLARRYDRCARKAYSTRTESSWHSQPPGWHRRSKAASRRSRVRIRPVRRAERGLDSTVLLTGLARARARAPGRHCARRTSITACMPIPERGRTMRAPGDELGCRWYRSGWTRGPRRESPEEVARKSRYAALAGLLEADEVLLTAHHADDQSKPCCCSGCGRRAALVAGMPAVAAFAAGWHARPLLGFSRGELHAWACEARLAWLEASV